MSRSGIPGATPQVQTLGSISAASMLGPEHKKSKSNTIRSVADPKDQFIVSIQDMVFAYTLHFDLGENSQLHTARAAHII